MKEKSHKKVKLFVQSFIYAHTSLIIKFTANEKNHLRSISTNVQRTYIKLTKPVLLRRFGEWKTRFAAEQILLSFQIWIGSFRCECLYHLTLWCKCCVFLLFALILPCWCWNSSLSFCLLVVFHTLAHCLITAYMEISLLNTTALLVCGLCCVHCIRLRVLFMEVYYTQPIHELHLLMNAILLDFKIIIIIIILIELWSTTFNTIGFVCWNIVNEKFSGSLYTSTPRVTCEWNALSKLASINWWIQIDLLIELYA